MTLLALADTMAGLALMVGSITGAGEITTPLIPHHIFQVDSIHCVVLSAFAELAIALSTMGLLLLSTDQLLRIEFNLKYHAYASRRNALVALGVLFIYAIMYISLQTVLTFKDTSQDSSCSFIEAYPSWFNMCGYVMLLALPAFLIGLINARILYLSVVQLRKVRQLHPQVNHPRLEVLELSDSQQIEPTHQNATTCSVSHGVGVQPLHVISNPSGRVTRKALPGHSGKQHSLCSLL